MKKFKVYASKRINIGCDKEIIKALIKRVGEEGTKDLDKLEIRFNYENDFFFELNNLEILNLNLKENELPESNWENIFEVNYKKRDILKAIEDFEYKFNCSNKGAIGICFYIPKEKMMENLSYVVSKARKSKYELVKYIGWQVPAEDFLDSQIEKNKKKIEKLRKEKSEFDSAIDKKINALKKI